MDTAQTPTIRNVALVGHSGAGKTTLAEALLHRAGVVPRLGRVEEGTTVCDTEPEEIKRGISLSPAIAPFLWTASDGLAYTINLIDTPGYADFAGGVDAALAVADLALVVVSAVDGVEVGTEIVWQQCAELGIPRMIFLTKEDKPRADFHRVLDQMRATFGSGLVPLEIPIGEEEAFHGIADVLSDTGFGYDGEGQHHTEPIPDDVAAEEQRVHDEVAEEIVSGDDEQLERYLSGEVPSATELERALVHEVRECAEFPVLVGSALTGVGVDRLADYLCELGPSPADRPATVHAGKLDGPATEVDANPEGDPLLYVFRTVADPFVGQVSLFKVLSGTVANEDRLINAVTGTEERLHGLFKLRGKEHLAVERIAAGDIGAVAKLAATPTGSTLAKRGMTVHVTCTVMPRLARVEPVGVAASLATAPMSPAAIRSTARCSLPRSLNRPCRRSSVPVTALISRSSLATVPESTLNSETWPTNGSATVRKTYSSGSPSGFASTSVAGPSNFPACTVAGRSAGEGPSSHR